MRFHDTRLLVQDGRRWCAAVWCIRPDDAGRQRVFGEMPDRYLKAVLRRGSGPEEGSTVLLDGRAYRCSARLEYPLHTLLILERCVR